MSELIYFIFGMIAGFIGAIMIGYKMVQKERKDDHEV